MPIAGGSCRKSLNRIAVRMVQPKSTMTPSEPGLAVMLSVWGSGFVLGTREIHDDGGHQPVHRRGHEEVEEFGEAELAGLPDHQCGDVTEGREGAAGVGRDHKRNAGQCHEARRVGADGQNHRAHDQCGGQVVEQGRQEEGQDAGEPEQLAIAEAKVDQLDPQHLEDAAFFQRVHIGDGDQQEQEQLAILLDHFERLRMHLAAASGHRIGDPDQRPDQPRGHHHGLGFAHLGGFFENHEDIGAHEDDQGEDPRPMTGQI